MKKVLSIFLILIMSIALSGCSLFDKKSEPVDAVSADRGEPETSSSASEASATSDTDDPEDPLFRNELTRVRIGDKYGFADKRGDLVIDAVYDNASGFTRFGYARVEISDQPTARIGFIDGAGRLLGDRWFTGFSGFAKNGLAAAREAGKKWGYVDRSFDYVIEPQFDMANEFSSNGLARASRGDECGFIDVSGSYVLGSDIPAAYFFGLKGFADNGLAAAVNGDGLWGFINDRGEYVIEPRFDAVRDFSDCGVACVKVGDLYGVIDGAGNYVFEPQFSNFALFHVDGLAYYKYDGSTTAGFIRADGSIITGPDYLLDGWNFEFVRDLCLVYRYDPNGDGGYGYLKRNGDELTETRFSAAKSFSKYGLAAVFDRTGWGYINVDGAFVIDPVFKDAGSFGKNGLAPVLKDDKWGYIDSRGSFAIEPRFDKAGGFYDDGFAVVNAGGKFGVINERGETVVEPIYDGIG